MRKLLILLALSATPLLFSGSSNASAPEPELRKDRKLEFTYNVEIPAESLKQSPVDLFIPLAETDEHQEILNRTVNASVPGKEGKEDRYGNKFWHAHIDKPDGKPVTVQVKYLVKRKLYTTTPKDVADLSFTPKELEQEAAHLQPDKLVPVSGELIERVSKDLPKTEKNTPYYRSRAIYDYVVDTMEYKKVGEGWGNGDTHWACSQRYGNCTDFHALFTSLARAENIPSKFEIGFPVPEDTKEGAIGGYHCWVTFKLPRVGWVPLDASEAKKHPERRELLFGTHPVDRIKFTTGRDLVLGEGHNTKPLNYFVYPHMEVGGKVSKEYKTSFSFRDL